MQLCERKRELEVSAAIREAEAREKATEEQLKRLPEHQQQLLQVSLVYGFASTILLYPRFGVIRRCWPRLGVHRTPNVWLCQEVCRAFA